MIYQFLLTQKKSFLMQKEMESVSWNDRPSTIDSTLKACDHDMYPNFHVLLIICATFPVTSCKCEQLGMSLLIFVT